MRGFIEKSAPLLGIGIDGDLDSIFSIHPEREGALDEIWPVLEQYPAGLRDRLTVRKPGPQEECIWLRPGEPVFVKILEQVRSRFGRSALSGATFLDPWAADPYMFHLCRLTVKRDADDSIKGLGTSETVESKLVGLRQSPGGELTQWPVEHLLLLKSCDGVPVEYRSFSREAAGLADRAGAYARENLVQSMVEKHRKRLEEELSERESYIRNGYDHLEGYLATQRSELRKKAASGHAGAAERLRDIKEQQHRLSSRRKDAIERMRAESELLGPGEISFVAHALVVPASDPAERERHDARTEKVAMQLAIASEEAAGARVQDVSDPENARGAGLNDWPGFDLLSDRPDEERRAIEVKGRALRGEVELSDNEWARACSLREGYWLYVVYGCAGSDPKLHRIRDPFGELIARAKGGVVIEESEVVRAAE